MKPKLNLNIRKLLLLAEWRIVIPRAAFAQAKKPNILVIWETISAGITQSPTTVASWVIERPTSTASAKKARFPSTGMGSSSCTAGRAALITGQSPIRTGLTKVGLPGADIGLRAEDPTVAEVMKNLGYATGQFGKNHLGDRNEVPADRPRLR